MTILVAAQMNVSVGGTGSLQLNANIPGFISFASAGAVNNQIFSYGIQDTALTYEYGQATYITNSTGNFLTSRTIQFSSNTTAATDPINVSTSANVYGTFLQHDYDTLTPANSLNIGANLTINSSTFFLGNSTANSFGNTTVESFANATAQTTFTPGTVRLSGTGSNQGLIVGTPSIGAAAVNGYSFMPNGLIIQWGVVTGVNTSAGSATFKTPFPTACIGIVGTAQNVAWSVNATGVVCLNCNSSVAVFRNGNTGSTINVFYMAIGN